MTQLEAHVTVIEYVRSQAPQEKRVLQALRVFEKRHGILRARHELRHATIAPDILDEPLTLSWQAVRAIYESEACEGCFRKKAPRNAFCTKCFRSLDGATRKAFAGHTFHAAFCRGMRLLGWSATQTARGAWLLSPPPTVLERITRRREKLGIAA